MDYEGELQFTNATEFNTEARLRSIHDMRTACRDMRVKMSDPGYRERYPQDHLLTMYYEAVRTYVFEIEHYIRDVEEDIQMALWEDTDFGVVRLPMPEKVRRRRNELGTVSDSVRVYAENQFKISGFRDFIRIGSPMMVEWQIDAVTGMRHREESIVHPHGIPMDTSDVGFRRANQFLFRLGVDMEISYRDYVPGPEASPGL